jgi:hypothetical protein
MSYPKVIIDDFNIEMFDENSTEAKRPSKVYQSLISGTSLFKNHGNLQQLY